MKYEPVIGLEVHAELLTKSKMFCGCEVVDSITAKPNRYICPVCTGQPGALPVLNKKAVELAIRVGLALGCEIHTESIFARKNYFYPDLPKGYQISQYDQPLATDGKIQIETEAGIKEVRIRRVHLEEDTGKLSHADAHSFIDYNRSGVPLLEIVTEPDLRSPEEVRAYATKLHAILRYLDVNSGDMEKGVIRFEANVSVREEGSDQLNTRTEIKNLNSFRALRWERNMRSNAKLKFIRAAERLNRKRWDLTKPQGKHTHSAARKARTIIVTSPNPTCLRLCLMLIGLSRFVQACPNYPKQRRAASSNNMN